MNRNYPDYESRKGLKFLTIIESGQNSGVFANEKADFIGRMNKMKGIWPRAVIVLFLLIVFSVMQVTKKEENRSGAAGIKFNEVTGVGFYDGRGFNETYTLSDPAKIYEFTAQLESIQ